MRGLPRLDDRLDQLRRIPFRRDDVVALGLQPRLEQLSLRRLTGAVGPFEGDEKPPPPFRLREPIAHARQQALLGRHRLIWIEELTTSIIARPGGPWRH